MPDPLVLCVIDFPSSRTGRIHDQTALDRQVHRDLLAGEKLASGGDRSAHAREILDLYQEIAAFAQIGRPNNGAAQRARCPVRTLLDPDLARPDAERDGRPGSGALLSMPGTK